MKRLVIASALLLALATMIVAPGLCYEQKLDEVPIDNNAVYEHWIDAKGFITYQTEDGEMVTKEFIRYRDLKYQLKDKKVGHFKCVYEDMDTQVPVGDIKRVVNSPSEKMAVITRQDGTSFEVSMERDLGVSLTNMTTILLNYHNQLNDQNEFGYVSGVKVREIVFSEPVEVDY
jgi:ribosomal protein S6